jgi:hypothetical protein
MAAMVNTIGCKSDPKPSGDKTPTGANAAVAADAAGSADAGSADAGPNILFKKGPKPSDDTVIAKIGDTVVDWSDYQHAVRVGRLFGPSTPDGGTEEIEPATLATPHLQVMMSRSLLSRQIVMQELERRGIEITDDEVRAWLEADNRLSRWAKHLDDREKLAAELGKLGVTVDDFLRLGREQVGQKKLQDALVADIAPDELWDAYRYENDTVRIIGVSSLNIPSSDELDAFTKNEKAAIKKYFEENAQRYTYPTRANAIVLVAKPEETDRSKLEAAMNELSAADANPEEIAVKHGLAPKLEQLFTKPEDQALFAAKPGEVGLTWKSPRGSYVWKKVAEVPPQLRELSFGLEREIAATIIRESRVTADARKTLEEAEKKLREASIDFGNVERDDVKPLLDSLNAIDGVEAKLTPDFPRAQNGFVPGFGIHEELAAAAFTATKKKPYPAKPLRSRDRAFTFRLVGRNVPSKADFEKEKEAFAQTFRERARMGIVDRFVQKQFGGDKPDINLDPVHVVYGELQKPARP